MTSVSVLITQRRNVAKSVDYFQGRLFVCVFVCLFVCVFVSLFVCLSTLWVDALYKKFGRVTIWVTTLKTKTKA